MTKKRNGKKAGLTSPGNSGRPGDLGSPPPGSNNVPDPGHTTPEKPLTGPDIVPAMPGESGRRSGEGFQK